MDNTNAKLKIVQMPDYLGLPINDPIRPRDLISEASNELSKSIYRYEQEIVLLDKLALRDLRIGLVFSSFALIFLVISVFFQRPFENVLDLLYLIIPRFLAVSVSFSIAFFFLRSYLNSREKKREFLELLGKVDLLISTLHINSSESVPHVFDKIGKSLFEVWKFQNMIPPTER